MKGVYKTGTWRRDIRQNDRKVKVGRMKMTRVEVIRMTEHDGIQQNDSRRITTRMMTEQKCHSTE